jgi:hypothetical protein
MMLEPKPPELELLAMGRENEGSMVDREIEFMFVFIRMWLQIKPAFFWV